MYPLGILRITASHIISYQLSVISTSYLSSRLEILTVGDAFGEKAYPTTVLNFLFYEVIAGCALKRRSTDDPLKRVRLRPYFLVTKHPI